jgi:ATP-dependent DNA helicase RecG
MASELMKAMFGGIRQAADPVEAQEAQVEAQEAQLGAQETLPQWQKAVLEFCLSGEKTSRELMAIAGYESRTGNFKKGLQRMLEQKLIELTLPDKPNSRLQKYRLTNRGRQALSAGHEGAK